MLTLFKLRGFGWRLLPYKRFPCHQWSRLLLLRLCSLSLLASCTAPFVNDFEIRFHSANMDSSLVCFSVFATQTSVSSSLARMSCHASLPESILPHITVTDLIFHTFHPHSQRSGTLNGLGTPILRSILALLFELFLVICAHITRILHATVTVTVTGRRMDFGHPFPAHFFLFSSSSILLRTHSSYNSHSHRACTERRMDFGHPFSAHFLPFSSHSHHTDSSCNSHCHSILQQQSQHALSAEWTSDTHSPLISCSSLRALRAHITRTLHTTVTVTGAEWTSDTHSPLTSCSSLRALVHSSYNSHSHSILHTTVTVTVSFLALALVLFVLATLARHLHNCHTVVTFIPSCTPRTSRFCFSHNAFAFSCVLVCFPSSATASQVTPELLFKMRHPVFVLRNLLFVLITMLKCIGTQ